MHLVSDLLRAAICVALWIAIMVLVLPRIRQAFGNLDKTKNYRLIRFFFGQRGLDRVILGQARMSKREEIAKSLGIDVIEVMKREKAGEISLGL